MRERAAQIWRNERGAVPDFETGDALWEAMREDGQEAQEWDPEPPESSTADPDADGPDGPGLD